MLGGGPGEGGGDRDNRSKRKGSGPPPPWFLGRAMVPHTIFATAGTLLL